MMKCLSDDTIMYHTTDDTPVEIDIYLYGRCHLFALALSEMTGLKVGALFSDADPEENNGNDTYLEHAFCYHLTDESLVIDAKGVSTKADMMAEYGELGFNTEEITDAGAILKQWITDNHLHDFNTPLNLFDNESPLIHNEKANVKKFILLHSDFFKLDNFIKQSKPKNNNNKKRKKMYD